MAWREWSSTATWAYCQPAPPLRGPSSSRTRLPTCQKRPSFLMSRCTSSPTAAYSYRFAGGLGWRWAREQSCRLSTRQIVDAGRPSAADNERGPHPVWRRSSTICASASGDSRCGQCLAIGGRSRNASQPPCWYRRSSRYAVARLIPHAAEAACGLKPRKHQPDQPTPRLPRMTQSDRWPTLYHHGPPSSGVFVNHKARRRPGQRQPSRRLIGPTARKL